MTRQTSLPGTKTTKYAEVRETFTWQEALAASERPCILEGYDRSSRGIYNKEESWDLNSGYEGFMDLAADRWPDGEEKAERLASKIAATVRGKIERLDPVYVEQDGRDIDVAAFVSGEPECWLDFNKTELESEGGKLVHIVANLCCSGGIEASVLVTRGAAIAALVQSLEYAGKRVRLDVIMFNGGYSAFSGKIANGQRVGTRIRVKDYQHALDFPVAVIATAHPATFRRLGFSLWESMPGFSKTRLAALGVPSGGYGSVTDPPRGDDWRGDIYLPGATYSDAQWETEAAAQQWVFDHLKKFGVDLKKDA